MKLSIVVVNYNVRHFLEQCLSSVKRAIENIEAEVFVVDNASIDGSVEFIRQKFPFVNVIANSNNVGFSAANNLALVNVTGEYILLLNPDTVVAEDTFEKCLAFMQIHHDAGGLGVRMVDGKGNFLPESKRGLPTPLVAFSKIFGLAKLFPRSRTFGKYHLGYLSEQETNEVEILSGAFMLIRKSVLDKAGLLDQTFFMYGEDIDLSYRITKTGYKNYYFPETTILHYKGESTKKGSLNYVRMFYKAMLIFYKKHFGHQSPLFALLINFAIVFRGMLTLLAGLFASSYLFLIDALLGFTGIYFIKSYWEDTIKYSNHYYPNEFLFIVVPIYIFIWITSVFLSGGYEKPFRVSDIIKGILFGTVAIAVFYAFIPDEWRFSRAIILLGAGWTAFEMLFTRTSYNLIRHQTLSVENDDEKRSLIVGAIEGPRAEAILYAHGNSKEIISASNLTEAKKTAAIYRANEIIFCSRELSFKEIIHCISTWGNKNDYKILNEGSDALIGSNSKDSAGDLYVAEKSYALFKPANLLRKRMADVSICFFLILLFPIHFFMMKKPAKFFSNWLSVFAGYKWWVGFHSSQNLKSFAHAKQGVISPVEALRDFALTEEDKTLAEVNYARHFSVLADLRLLLKHYVSLGN